MQSAARITDVHACSSSGPNAGATLQIEQGSPNIFINGLPAARVGDAVSCRMAEGSAPVICEGSSTVFFNGKPAARMGDKISNGGSIIQGSSNVFIGDGGTIIQIGDGCKVTFNEGCNVYLSCSPPKQSSDSQASFNSNDASQNQPPLPNNHSDDDDSSMSAFANMLSASEMMLCKLQAGSMVLAGGAVEITGGGMSVVPIDGGPLSGVPVMTGGTILATAGIVAWKACDEIKAQPPVYYKKGMTNGGKQEENCSTCSSGYKKPPKDLKAFPDAKKTKPKNQRRRWKDSDGRIYEWDSQHGAVEIYNKTGNVHLGEFDAETGAQTKPADPSRSTDN